MTDRTVVGPMELRIAEMEGHPKDDGGSVP